MVWDKLVLNPQSYRMDWDKLVLKKTNDLTPACPRLRREASRQAGNNQTGILTPTR
jgi:hypothetical protein